jgi:Trp operon repressor
LLATDDEAFTYNKGVSRLAIVQEHFMILRAIERGVSEKRIANALNVDIAHIKRRRRMLRGICSQAVDLLRDKSVNPVTFDMLRKMKPGRQAEACQFDAFRIELFVRLCQGPARCHEGRRAR